LSRPQTLSVTADEELTAAIGADRVLMLRHVPVEVRPALEALWQVDAAMGDVVARSTQPALAAVKLAWWRDRLEELDTGRAPAEPRLRAAAEYLLPANVTGAELATLEDGWAALLEEEVDAVRVAKRGSLLFCLAARLFGIEHASIGGAGALYALVSVGRRGVPQLLENAKSYAQDLASQGFPGPLRPLTGLARLAARDLKRGEPFEPEGSPPRLAAMLRHRLTGRI
jgi:15-cis-phytoene synthase